MKMKMKNGSLFDKLPSNFNNEKLDPYKVLFGTYISPKPIQITKINKSGKLLQGQNGNKKKRGTKVNKEFTSCENSQAARIRRLREFAGCENSQPCENSQELRNFATLAKLIGFAAFFLCLFLVLPSVFWFCSFVFQLISSCSS